MNVKMIVPADFDASGKTKYPVLMQVYGGPNSQTTSLSFKIDFMYKLVAQNVITMFVDGRGTGFKGRVYRSSVSSHLGEVEVEDQITAAKWAAAQSFVNSKKIGIWGWSYGGYMTTKVLEVNSGVISLGMAVAPVTDWKYYDSVYTERYMKTPQLNPDGYKKSAVVNMEGFKHASFLMIHGTADGNAHYLFLDNVHFQNSAELVWHLTGAGVTEYTSQYYTDSDHSIYDNGANPAVFSKLEKFVCNEWELNCVF